MRSLPVVQLVRYLVSQRSTAGGYIFSSACLERKCEMCGAYDELAVVPKSQCGLNWKEWFYSS